MPPEGERSGPWKGRPDNNSPAPMVADWAATEECAREWVAWTARRRWPEFAVNDDIWAASVTGWELCGGRSAA